MKNLFLILFVLIVQVCFSQIINTDTINQSKNFTDDLNLDEDGYIIMPFNDDSTKINYYQVVDVPNLTKAEILDLLQKWSIAYFPFKKNALAKTEVLADGIILRSNFRVQMGNPSTDERYLFYTLEVGVKEGKYKLEFNNFLLGKSKDNELENFYEIKKLRKPRQLLFRDIHEAVIKIKNALVSSIVKKKDW